MANEHWTNKYIGREHTEEFDCAELCIEVERDQYNRTVSLPNRAFYEKGQNRNSDIESVLSHFEPVTTPKDGDIVLMANGRNLNHVGVFVVLNNRDYILHCIERVGTILQKVKDVHKYTLKIQGFYRLKEEAIELKEELNNVSNCSHTQSAIST